MAPHAYVIKYVPSVNLDEALRADRLCGIKTYVNSPYGKNLHLLLLCIPAPLLVWILSCQTLGVVGAHGDAGNDEFLDDIKCPKFRSWTKLRTYFVGQAIPLI